MNENLRSSVYNEKNSRYVMGGTTEVSAGFVEWWERRIPEYDPTDIVYFLEAKYVGRPDLLATAWWGDAGLEWVIPWFNNLLDPDEELVAGKMLLMPTAEKLAMLRNGMTVGGVPSTRI